MRTWVGTGRAVYIGPSLQLAAHSGAVACLALGLDAPLRVDVGATAVRARSVLVPARVRHRVTADGGTAFCYLDPAGRRHASCRDRMRPTPAGVHVDHADEPALLGLARAGAAAALVRAAAPPGSRSDRPLADPRIDRAVRLLGTPAGVDLPAGALAAALGLSTSRFLHLFAAQTQTSLRRYRSWCRMVLAARALAAGADLTRAAADAGFATPSHFSAAFRRMFGLSPGRLLAGGGRPVVWADRDAAAGS